MSNKEKGEKAMSAQRATLKYQIATYSGEVTILCDSSDDNETLEAIAKRQLTKRAGPLPFGYESWQIVEREDIDY